jgi:hypothetical protein
MRFAIVAMFVLGCGSSGGSQIDGNPGKLDGMGSGSGSGSADAGIYDFGCGGNTACTLDKVCCSMPGMPTTFGCVLPAACTMPDKIVCDGPDECGGATPVCCGVYAADGTGTYPQCGIATLGTSCTSAAACPTHLETTCTDTTKVQICHISAECTDATNNKCCTFQSGTTTLSFCIDSFTAQVAGATCN